MYHKVWSYSTVFLFVFKKLLRDGLTQMLALVLDLLTIINIQNSPIHPLNHFFVFGVTLCNVIIETDFIWSCKPGSSWMYFLLRLFVFKYQENLHNFSEFLSLLKSAGFCLYSCFSHAASNSTSFWSWLLSPSLFLLTVFSLKREWRRMRDERSLADSLWRAFLCGLDFFFFRTSSSQYTYTNTHTDVHSFSRFLGHLHNI